MEDNISRIVWESVNKEPKIRKMNRQTESLLTATEYSAFIIQLFLHLTDK